MLATLLWTLLLILVVMLAVSVLVLHLAAPTARRVFEQQRIEHERRLAEWRVSQATQAAMSEMLDEARRSRS